MSFRKPRILHFIESEGVYGAERVILNLSTQLKINATYIPVVGCIVPQHDSPSALYDAAIQLGIEAVKIPIANSKLHRDLFSAAKYIKQLNIDLIHSHGYKPSVFGFVIKMLTRIPVIATCHLWFEPSKGPLKMRIMIRLEKFFYRWFPQVIAVSEPIKAILLASNLRPDQVTLVRNGVDIPNMQLSAEETQVLRNQLKLGQDDFCVLNSARLTRQKAQWVLIEAAAILKKQQQPVRILVVGEGGLAQELTEQIQRLGVSEQVSLLGFRADVNKLLAICDAFALPSIDEGMPMALLEAAAARKAIVSTLVGDIGKLISHEQTGLVIPLEDPAALAEAILTLKQDAALANQLATAAHTRMKENYSSEAMCTLYTQIYDQLFAQQR